MSDERPILCHGDTTAGGIFAYGQPVWRAPDGDHRYRGTGRSLGGGKFDWEPCSVCGRRYGSRRHGDPHRTCSYCGSIHPEDLLALDFEVKGWSESTDDAGKLKVELGTAGWADFKYGWPHKLYVDPPDGKQTHIKFYSIHLQDFPELIERFNERFRALGIAFGMGERGLMWGRAS